MKSQVFVAVVVFLVGFNHSGCKRQESPESPPGALSFSPEGASPGMMVRVTAGEPVFPDAAKTRVEIGGQPAPLVNWVSETEVEVLVPNVKAGAAKIEVRGERVKQAATFDVLPAAAQELVLELKNGRLELVAIHPTADAPDVMRESGVPQLSYDIVNSDGGIAFTGAIDHPAQSGMELFDGPAADRAILRREAPHAGSPVVFTIKVPAFRGATVKFYESAAGANLRDAAAREVREPVGEVKLEE